MKIDIDLIPNIIGFQFLCCIEQQINDEIFSGVLLTIFNIQLTIGINKPPQH